MGREYKVAISFLSEDLPTARGIQRRLASVVDGRIFLYPDYQGVLLGKSIDSGVADIFEHQSEVVVVLYRNGWGEKGGTLVEWRAIDRRRRGSRDDFLFPVVLERGATPPWADDLIHLDATRYDLEDLVTAICDRLGARPPARTLDDASSRAEMANNLRARLIGDFGVASDVYRGYFGGASAKNESRRWQTEGGESVDHAAIPKLPYYHTYWGYEAAVRIAPELVPQWRPITFSSIEAHFAGRRWLPAPREYSFEDGPRSGASVGQTVRHTVRAAELTALLAPDHPRVSEIAWELLRKADELQCSNGGWNEFIGDKERPALWSSVYVFRFLSKAAAGAPLRIDEPESFARQVRPRLAQTEQYLHSHWNEHRWVPNQRMRWDEGAAAVLLETAPYLTDTAITAEVYSALRETLTPAGRLCDMPDSPTAPSEFLYSLRLATAMKVAGDARDGGDSRYLRLREWVDAAFDAHALESYDIGFAAILFDLPPAATR